MVQMGRSLLIVSIVLVLSAFGGGGGADKFRKGADTICIDSAKQIGELIAEIGVPQSLAEDGTYREQALPIREEALNNLEELDPTRKLQPVFDDYLQNYEELNALDEQFIEAAASGDETAVEGISAAQSDLAEANRELATDLGLEACAERLPKKEAKKVRDVIEETFTTGDPDFCTELYTEQYVESQGGLEACEANEIDPASAVDAIEIENIRGIAKVYAVATITPEGGLNDGQPGIVELEYEEGVYKRSALYAAPPEDGGS